MKKALLATDSSQASLNAAHLVAELAAQNPDLTVTILHVVPLPEVLTPAAAAGAPLTLPGRLDDYINEVLPEVLKKTKEALGLPDERVTTKHAIGVPADAIIQEASQGGYDVILMGRRGLSPVKEFFLGSVSHAVLHAARCPVIVVP